MRSQLSPFQTQSIADGYARVAKETKDPKDLEKLELQRRANEAMLNSGITGQEAPKADTNPSPISNKK